MLWGLTPHNSQLALTITLTVVLTISGIITQTLTRRTDVDFALNGQAEAERPITPLRPESSYAAVVLAMGKDEPDPAGTAAQASIVPDSPRLRQRRTSLDRLTLGASVFDTGEEKPADVRHGDNNLNSAYGAQAVITAAVELREAEAARGAAHTPRMSVQEALAQSRDSESFAADNGGMDTVVGGYPTTGHPSYTVKLA
jgi:hypothetical protein